jgi:hypothetical protein
MTRCAIARDTPATLASAPLELDEGWGGAAADAGAVIQRVREACLSGIHLVSDRQPQKLRVDEQRAGPPHIWRHEENPDTAWVVVDFAPTHWVQLAYQFGHELGHVLCNSWVFAAQLDPPSRWLEEAMVEAFSIRGLGRLADSWAHTPPFPHDEGFAGEIRKYRDNLIERYRTAGGTKPAVSDTVQWFRASRPALDRASGVGPNEGPGIVAILGELESDADCVADLGAVNRWPQRSGIPSEEYLQRWQDSCAQVAAPGVLPGRLKTLFGLA